MILIMSEQKPKLPPRERILNTASDLFYRQGYHATGINQIIREAGVAKASFYDHFASKEDLAVAYLQARSDRWIRLLTDVTQSESPILSLFDFLHRWVQDTNYQGCAFLNIASEFPTSENRIRETVAEHKTKQRALFAEVISQLSLDTDVDELTNTLYLLFESALAESRIFRADWPVTVARQSVVRLVS